MTIQSLTEEYTAACLSMAQTRAYDGIRLIVLGCMSAVADCIMRKSAIDNPSEASAHLLGRTIDGKQLGHPGFGISVDTFELQTESSLFHYPELAIARAGILDYFHSPEQRRFQKIFTWEEFTDMKPNKALVKYLRMVARSMVLPVEALDEAPSLLSDGLPMKSIVVSF